MNTHDFSRRLLWHGLVVFILGLLSGMAMVGPIEIYRNLRRALASHLVGETTGMFLLIAGLMLERLRLSPSALHAAFWMSLYGAYGNWAGSFCGAVFGTQALSRVTGAGHAAADWQETLVTVLLSTSGIATLAGCAVFLWGLRHAYPPGDS